MKLYEVLAVEGGLREKLQAARKEVLSIFMDDSKFIGLVRKFNKLDESFPSIQDEQREVPYTVQELVSRLSQVFVDYANVSVSKEMANTKAFAEVSIDGAKFTLSATALLNLEGKLAELTGVVESIPTLSRGESWEFDEQNNLYVSSMKEQMRTTKVQQPIVLYEATKEHPAQTQLASVDKPAYAVQSVEFSGAIPDSKKRMILRRLEKLQDDVKQARQRANDVEIEKADVGDAISTYLFGTLI